MTTAEQYTRGIVVFMRASRLGMLAGSLAAIVWTACGPSSEVFVCSDDAECTGAGTGSCQSNGYCAFPDAQCDSGLRYGEYAGGGFSQVCVPVDEGSTGDMSASMTTTTSGPGTSDTTNTTGATPETSTDGTSGSVGDETSTSGGETGGTTTSCEILFEDAFDGGRLPVHWTVLGSGTVSVSNSAARFQLRTDPGSTMLRHGAVVPLEGSWLAVRVGDLSPEVAVQALVSMTTADAADMVILSVETGGANLVGYHAGGAVDDVLFSIPYDDAMPWLRIRELGGHVMFEIGASDEAWETIYEADVDLRGTSGWMEFGAANTDETPDEEIVSFEDASGCAVER